jgi:hypothetical protein
MDGKTNHARLLWDRAEECRAIAAILTDPDSKADYLRLAESYSELAAKEETLAKRAR